MNIKDLKLDTKIIEALVDLGFIDATPIQEKCIPLILEGKDVFGQSSTGSGKTAAFGLPMIQNIKQGHGIQALILTPTRELCVQVTNSLRDFSKYQRLNIISVYGGVSIDNQIRVIRSADIVVATPGRVLDHLKRNTIKFDKVRYLVLDEADKMFEMGFIDDVEIIISQVPKQRQTLLFSATVPNTVNHIIKKHMIDPISIKSSTHVDRSLLKQTYYQVKEFEKFSLVVSLLKKHPDGLSLVFCGTRRLTDVVARNLQAQGIHSMAIHGGLTQNRRAYALEALKKQDINVLVATDVAARGLDIKNVSHVYNYNVPKTSDEYIHRIGRTARAGSSGDAITLLSEKDYDNFNRVLYDRSISITKVVVPNFEKVNMIRFEQRPHRSFNNRDGHSQNRSWHNRDSNDHSRNRNSNEGNNENKTWGNAYSKNRNSPRRR